MSYAFYALSHADFEDLALDLIGRELNIRFEAFAAGPDGGMDGRHASAAGVTVLQAKHYAGSMYSKLKAQMKRERVSIDRLNPKRYILATSQSLTHVNKRELAALIGPSLKSEADIKGARELRALLRAFPEIAKAHIKLWLSETAVLERVLHAAAHAFIDITQREIEAKVRLYALNPSFRKAQETLETHRVLIVSGPPGVGKTTLAEVLCYAYAGEGWDLIAIRNLDDGLSAIDDTRKQIFLFDDFLGKVALDQRALSQKDSDLARFIKRVRASPNALFILTTRAYIFEEARRVSEYLADPALDVSKYVLDVGIYTRQIKARILYNHLAAAAIDPAHIVALITGGYLPRIVDHKNYNPRIIEWMTDIAHVNRLNADDYPTAFLKTLDHPDRLWDTAFRTHIARRCQHLLIALFFGPELAMATEDLRACYETLHVSLSAEYGERRTPKDFEESLRVLEGGFIILHGRVVAFVNPSLRDYLTQYLNDFVLLQHIAAAVGDGHSAERIWRHAIRLTLTDERRRTLALTFLRIARELVHAPRTKTTENGSIQYTYALSNTDRIELLIEWWKASGNEEFIDLARQIAQQPVGGLDAWQDGPDAVRVIYYLREQWYAYDVPYSAEIIDHLEFAFIKMVSAPMPLEELERISDSMNEWNASPEMRAIVNVAVERELSNVHRIVREVGAEAVLDEYPQMLEKLAKRAGIASKRIENALTIVEERMIELDERALPSKSPIVRAAIPAEAGEFDDAALSNLFAPLLDRAQ